MEKIYRTQDQVLSQKQLSTLIVTWIFAFASIYFVGITPLYTALVTQLMFIAYMFYAEIRYTCIKH